MTADDFVLVARDEKQHLAQHTAQNTAQHPAQHTTQVVEVYFAGGQRVDSQKARLLVVGHDYGQREFEREYGVKVRSWRVLTPRQRDDAVRRRVSVMVTEHARRHPYLRAEADEAVKSWDGCVEFCRLWMGIELEAPDAKF